MSRDILDTIDHALADWDTSPDAMRWAPEAEPETDDRPARVWVNRTPGQAPHTLRYEDGWHDVGWVDADAASLPGFPRAPRPVLEVRSLRITPLHFEPPRVSIGPIDLSRLNGARPDVVFFDEPARDQIIDQITQSARRLAAAFRGFAIAVQPIAAHLHAAAASESPEVPTDPRERALWVRQHRNTGPAATPFAHRGGSARH